MSAVGKSEGANCAPSGSSEAAEPHASGDRANDRALLEQQIAYYRARAPEYDAWWFRTGRFDRGEANNAAWRADAATVENAVVAMLERESPARVLELACGTGLFTRHLAPRVQALTAVDASPEVIEINRARVASNAVRYVEADLFAYEPDARYDCVFMSFWLSHVPAARFDAFWSMVRGALAPGGFAYVVDSAHDPTSTAANHPTPDRTAGIVTRRLDDGREFRIVKVFWEPQSLARRLRAVGFEADMTGTDRYFIYGMVRETSGSVGCSSE
jgi:demethylmenaquinone methyltransferase/2-methoxy-6-polyprenyl-1,4-benzoquinol methylase